jgi:hypothetical protein
MMAVVSLLLVPAQFALPVLDAVALLRLPQAVAGTIPRC